MLDVLAGFMVGLIVGLTGVGGGALMTPVLVLLFGWHPQRRWARPLVCGDHEACGRTVAAGALLGVLVTLTPIGAGAIGAVMLLYLYPLRMVPARLVGTDIVHAVPLTLVADVGHMAMGHVDLTLLGWLLLGSLPGVALGAMAGGKASEPALRAAIAFVLGLVGIKLVI